MSDVVAPNGPGAAYDVLFDADARPGVDGERADGLPDSFRAVFGGDLRLRMPDDRPWVGVNFVATHDGRVSYADRGVAGGGEVSGFDCHDTWIMGLLRARADAVLMGAATVRLEASHLWVPAHIAPYDAGAFASLRAAEGRTPQPVFVVVTASGRLPADAAVLAQTEIPIVVATTAAGEPGVAAWLGHRADAHVVVHPGRRVDLAAFVASLGADFGIRTVLCEGGAHLYGALLAQGCVDEEFLTLSPSLMGDRDGGDRPSLVEGVRFAYGAAPQLQLLGVRRAANHLYLRSQIVPAR